jgi:hypothetical protein
MVARVLTCAGQVAAPKGRPLLGGSNGPRPAACRHSGEPRKLEWHRACGGIWRIGRQCGSSLGGGYGTLYS